jgi:hypothetical protein
MIWGTLSSNGEAIAAIAVTGKVGRRDASVPRACLREWELYAVRVYAGA